MNRIFQSLVVAAAMGCSSTSAYGQESIPGNFLIAPSLLYHSGLRTRNSESKNSYLVYEARLGYQVHPEVFLGLHYQVEDENIENSGYSSANLNNTSVTKRTSIGASVGYVTSGLHLFFSYFLDSKWSLNTTSSGQQNRYDYNGAGFQVDVGYKIPLWGLFLGPQISYKKFSYGNLSTDGGSASSISPQLEETSVEPSLAIYYFF